MKAKRAVPFLHFPWRGIVLVLLLVCSFVSGFAQDAYPMSATLIPWSDRANLQSYLDADRALAQPKGCRLEPGKDYVPYSGGPSSITVRSNTKLYAISSRICPVNIAAGSSDIYLSGLLEGTITFVAGSSSQVTRRVTLNRVHYITLQGTACRIDELTWFDAYNVNVRFDCSTSGFVRNFRAIRLANQNNTQPYALIGNLTEPSYGNSILVGNFLNGGSPEGPRVYMENVREWLSILIGAESYYGPQNPWFSPIGVQAVRAFNTGGLVDRDHIWETDSPDVLLVANQLGTFWRDQGISTIQQNHFLPGVDAVVEIANPFPPQPWDATRTYRKWEQAYRNGNGYRSSVDGNLGRDPATDTLNWEAQAIIGTDERDETVAPSLRAVFFDNGATNAKTIRVNGVVSPATISAAQKTKIRSTVAAPATGLVPWAPPSYPTPRSDFSSLPVSSTTRAQIQAQLDTGSGVCLLPAGRYNLDGPLLLGTRADGIRRILIGAGRDQTVLYAPNATTDLINEKNDGPGASSIDLIGVTLSGGRWGVNLFSIQVNGQWVQRQYLDCYFAEVCIRDMSAGGWHIENIYGMDNNAYQGVDFVNCPIGWQQMGGSDASNNNWAYMDKNMWSGCQWLNCGVALDLHPTRASGGNIFLECRFQGCTTAIIPPPANHSPLSWVNCDFIDNGGNPVIYDYGECYFVSCRIHDSGQAASFYDGYHSIFEGCTFTKSGSSNCKVISSARESTISSLHIGLQNDYNGRTTHFLNSHVGMPVGQWYNGSAINSVLADSSDTYRAGAIVYADADRADYAGAPVPANKLYYTVLDASMPIPRPGVLLAGRTFQNPLSSLPAGVPVITSATSATLAYGSAVSFTGSASAIGGGVLAYNADLLPPGLAINPITGVISGTPASVGSWFCPVRASNANGVAVGWLTLTVIVAPSNAVITITVQ